MIRWRSGNLYDLKPSEVALVPIRQGTLEEGAYCNLILEPWIQEYAEKTLGVEFLFQLGVPQRLKKPYDNIILLACHQGTKECIGRLIWLCSMASERLVSHHLLAQGEQLCIPLIGDNSVTPPEISIGAVLAFEKHNPTIISSNPRHIQDEKQRQALKILQHNFGYSNPQNLFLTNKAE